MTREDLRNPHGTESDEAIPLHQFHIVMEGNNCFLTPPCSELVIPALNEMALLTEAGSQQRHRAHKLPVRLFRVVDSTLRFPMVFYRFVQSILRAGCLSVTVEDRSNSRRAFQPDEKQLVAQTFKDRSFLTAVDIFRRGVIRACDSEDIARKIALICDFYPHARTLILVKDPNAVRYWHRQLKFRSRRKVGQSEGGLAESNKTMLIRPYGGFDPGNWDMVIVPDALEAVTTSWLETWESARGLKAFSFLLEDTEVDPFDQFLLSIYCGGTISEMSGSSFSTGSE